MLHAAFHCHLHLFQLLMGAAVIVRANINTSSSVVVFGGLSAMPVPCWDCKGFTYWRRHHGCHNPQCWKSNEAAIQAGRHKFIARKRTKAFNKPPSPPPPERPRKRLMAPPPSWQVEQKRRLMLTDGDMKQETDVQDAEVGQGWTDNQDILHRLKHDPFFVQGPTTKMLTLAMCRPTTKMLTLARGRLTSKMLTLARGRLTSPNPWPWRRR